MSTQVYWIRAKYHSDMTSDGYVGVSKDAQKRWMYGHDWAHRKGRHDNPKLANAISKYGWENLVKTVLVIADESYCYELENKLRPSENIGWNLVTGGGKPPKTKFRGEGYVSPLKGIPRPTPWMVGATPPNKGKRSSAETRAKLSAKKKGTKQTPEQIAKRVASRRATLAAQGRTV
jgi:hypothetical protein